MRDTVLLQANRIHLTYRNALLQLAEAMTKHPFLNKKEQELRQVAANLQSPFNIAIFGRMKTGKSSLINALIGKQLAITGVEEATATINQLSYATGEQLNSFTVHWQNSAPQTFPIDQLQRDWTGKTPEVLSRVKRTDWLELYSDAPTLRDIHITDTPGTGAEVREHESIAKQFINGQKADALLYVFSPTGRKSDETDLIAFRNGCLPGSSLDNSVAVLHKWDHIYWEEDNWESITSKARRIHDFMQDLVSAVIPVSAPLGLIAKIAPETFWAECRQILSNFANEEALKKTLRANVLWTRLPQQQELFTKAEKLGCPWSSFCVLLRQLYRNPEAKEPDLILELSGIGKLEKLLDKQIFSVRSIIQQKQNCARARKILSDVYWEIDEEIKRLNDNVDIMNKIYTLIDDSHPDAKLWLDTLRGNTAFKKEQLQRDFLELDQLRIHVQEWADTITNAHDLIPWITQLNNTEFCAEECRICSRILRSLLPQNTEALNISKNDVASILNKLNRLKLHPCADVKNNAARLCNCLMYWYKS